VRVMPPDSSARCNSGTKKSSVVIICSRKRASPTGGEEETTAGKGVGKASPGRGDKAVAGKTSPEPRGRNWTPR